jgi:hypothetical protein
MPYITQERRDAIDLDHEIPETAGELNYLFTTIIVDYLNTDNGPNYQKINDVMGALEGAKMEMYRRVAIPYEDVKIEQNGDVF